MHSRGYFNRPRKGRKMRICQSELEHVGDGCTQAATFEVQLPFGTHLLCEDCLEDYEEEGYVLEFRPLLEEEL